MNYTLLLIIILIISSIGHIYILNGRVMNKLVSFLPATPHSELETSKHSNKGRVDNLRIILTVMLLLGPLFLFKSLRNASIEDISIASILLAIITIISIVGFWFSATRLKKGKFGCGAGFLDKSSDSFLNNEQAHIKLIARSNRLYNRKKTKRENLVIGNQFIEFLNIVNEFELYDKTRHHFDLGGYRIQEKGRNLTPAQACFTLTFFWYHEVLKTNYYIKTVEDIIWECWKSHLKINAPLTKGNWKKFKGNYLHNNRAENKYLDLIETKFYTSFKEFYDKNHLKVNQVN